MFPLEIQLQIFEALAKDTSTTIHQIQHLLYASPLLLRRITQSHQHLLQPFVLSRLNLTLDLLLVRVLNGNPTLLSKNGIVVKIDWWHLLRLSQQDLLCERCFQTSPAVGCDGAIQASAFESKNLQIKVYSTLLQPVSWKRDWAVCPPCCFRQLDTAGCLKDARKAKAAAAIEPITILDLSASKNQEDSLFNVAESTTSRVVQEWRDRAVARKKQRTALRNEQKSERRRWGGGGVSGWSFGLEDEVDNEDSDDEDDSGFDFGDQEPKELPSEISLLVHPVASAVEGDSVSCSHPNHTNLSAILSKKCDGCGHRFCRTCINSIDACESCNAQLCLGCFPPPLNFFQNSAFNSENVALYADIDRCNRKDRVLELSFGGTSSVGRLLKCSSCNAPACAGCGDLEDWMLKVSGYGGSDGGGARREQDFICVDCRDCKSRMNFDYSSWWD